MCKEKNRLYRELLGQTGFLPPSIKDTGKYAHDIVGLIHYKLQTNGVMHPPVLLSTIAEDFSINPAFRLKPLGSNMGTMKFDQDQGCFVITINQSLTRDPQQISLATETDLNPGGRFTYAHEIAHRFFYIPSPEKGYERCISLAVSDPQEPKSKGVIIDLKDQEERLCNYIARRVLLPEFLVAKWAKEHGYDVNTPFPEIGNLVSKLSQDFLVPYPSAIFAFRDAVRRGNIPQDPNLFAVYLTALMRGTRVRAIRFESSFGPFLGNQLEIKPPFLQHIWEQDIYSNGLLGPNFRNFAREVFIKEGGETQPITDLSIVIRNRVACLSGWVQPVFTDPEYRSVLIWGRLY